jgi:hypothetical protein
MIDVEFKNKNIKYFLFKNNYIIIMIISMYI